MPSVDDPRGDRERYERELELLQELDETDAAALETWAKGQSTKPSTRAGHLQRLRSLSRRAPCPLVEITEQQFNNLLHDIKRGHHPDVKEGGLAESTMRVQRQSAKLFLRDQVGLDWAEEIDTGAPERSPVSAEDLLDEDEVSALLEASTEPRDTALIATLLATGQRITALLSLRVGDVDLAGQTGTIHLNDEAIGLKGASGPRPLTWATQYVAQWLDAHPRADEPDAPLFCTLKAGQGGNADSRVREYDEGDVLSRFQAHSRIKDVAAAAGVPEERVKPHNFRHAAITRMARDGVPEQRIKWMVGWAKDSSQFKRYQHVRDEEMLQAFREERGLDTDDGPRVGAPTLETCPRCDAALRGGASFCANCGLALDQEAARSVSQATDRTREASVTDPEPTDRISKEQLTQWVEENPAAVAEILHQSDTSTPADSA